MVFPNTDQVFSIAGPTGELELATTFARDHSPVAIICHPHPLFGGTMQNKVVTTLAKTFREINYATVRFNFRGVGKSAGSYGDGIGEVEDLLAVVAWIKKVLPERKIYLAGFSFGGFVATKVATKIFPEKLICVAPAVEHFDMSSLQVPCPWILIQGNEDEVVPYQAVLGWAKTQSIPPHLIEIKGATHFFHGKLIELRERLIDALKNQ